MALFENGWVNSDVKIKKVKFNLDKICQITFNQEANRLDVDIDFKKGSRFLDDRIFRIKMSFKTNRLSDSLL
jgi:hypothetical protein